MFLDSSFYRQAGGSPGPVSRPLAADSWALSPSRTPGCTRRQVPFESALASTVHEAFPSYDRVTERSYAFLGKSVLD